MKVKVEIDAAYEEPEVLIRCSSLDESVIGLQKYLTGAGSGKQCISLFKGATEYYIPVEEIYFFETEGKEIRAHTADRLFEARYKLYELEELLPANFMRVSKSTIINLDVIYSITRNLTASSVVEFAGSSKKALVSRSYYKVLIDRIAQHRMGRRSRNGN